jgi:hypothetical protein
MISAAHEGLTGGLSKAAEWPSQNQQVANPSQMGFSEPRADHLPGYRLNPSTGRELIPRAARTRCYILNLVRDSVMKRSFAWICWLLLFATACCVHVQAQAPGTKQAVIEVPFEFIHGAIVVQASVNGQGPFSMMLDTGADPSVVELQTAKNVGLKLAANGQQGSGGGTGVNLAYETVLPVVQIGGLTATHVDAVAMDLSKVGSALGRPLGGVLGYSLLIIHAHSLGDKHHGRIVHRHRAYHHVAHRAFSIFQFTIEPDRADRMRSGHIFA